MKIVIPGGSGQVGTVLARAFHAGGHEVAVLSRRPHPAPWRVVPWDGATPGEWESELEGAAALDPSAGSVADSDADGVLLDESSEQLVRSATVSRTATTARVAVRRGGSTGTA